MHRMSHRPLPTRGTVMAVLEGGTYRVELPGGGLADVAPSFDAGDPAVGYAVGDNVRVELDPYDTSRGRIVGREPGDDA